MTPTTPAAFPPVYASQARTLEGVLLAIRSMVRAYDRPIDDPDDRDAFTGIMTLVDLAHRDAEHLADNLDSLVPDVEDCHALSLDTRTA